MNLYMVLHHRLGYLHVFAETRGKARAHYLGYADDFMGGSPDWVEPLSIRLLAKGLDVGSGVDDLFKWSLENGFISNEETESEGEE